MNTELKRFLHQLKRMRHTLPRQTLLTLRGQAVSGDVAGAWRGLSRIDKTT
ncbi:MAG: hypothetical protein SCK57_09290 [Bacillota bacterium]|nr:hypothetical protein [Bacillota bacterium]MDW7677842.1 hypothetical protein [Bacillota bacterium]